MSTKTFMILCVVSGLGLGGGAWALFGRPAEAQPGADVPQQFSVENIKKSMDEPEQMVKTFNSMRNDELTEEQRQAARKNMGLAFREMLNESVDEYFNADVADRNDVLDAHLDEWIAKRENWKNAWEKQKKEDGNEESESERREDWRKKMASRSTQERKEWSESQNPDQMARVMTYFTAMRMRASARGIDMGWGRGGGGRGGKGGGRRGP
ncbi:MAG: hypothetical protein ACYTHJ_08760 [Planctomycetota bacterium]|jgi:hypothetical protein